MAHVAPVVDSEPLENEPPEQPYKQAILPLIALASSMVAVGFYFALSQDDPYQFEQAPAPQPAIETTLPSGLLPQPLANGLRVEASSGRSAFRIAQASASGEGAQAGMQASFEVQREPEGARVTQSFEQPSVLLWQGDVSNAVALDVSIQIETILSDAHATFSLSPEGAFTDYLWTSALNPQLRPTFKILADAQMLLAPKVRQGALRAGESWTYSLPWAGGAGGLSTDAALTMKMTYRGITPGAQPQAAIQVDVSTKGTLGEDTLVTGKGQGVLLMRVDDQGSARVGRFAFGLEQTLTRAGESTRTSFVFERVALASPEVGQE